MEKQDPPPKALLNRPDLWTELHLIWEAFWVLSSGRPVGFGPSPIPFSEILAYTSDWMGLTRWSDRHRAVVLLKAMDGAYLEHISKEKPKS